MQGLVPPPACGPVFEQVVFDIQVQRDVSAATVFVVMSSHVFDVLSAKLSLLGRRFAQVLQATVSLPCRHVFSNWLGAACPALPASVA